MNKINSYIVKNWENPKTKNIISFAVSDSVKRYTDNLFFGFDIPGEAMPDNEKYKPFYYKFQSLFSNLSSTVKINGREFYLIDDIFYFVCCMEYKQYEEKILRIFSLSGVGIIPLVDEVCGNRVISHSEDFQKTLEKLSKI